MAPRKKRYIPRFIGPPKPKERRVRLSNFGPLTAKDIGNLLVRIPGGINGYAWLHRTAAESYMKLRSDMLADIGWDLRCGSGWRPSSHHKYANEAEYFKAAEAKLIADGAIGPGLPENVKIAKIKKLLGGYSPLGGPHTTGLAVDLGILVSGGVTIDDVKSKNQHVMELSPAYLWLVENASKYGFYPYNGEAWHWEYNPPGWNFEKWSNGLDIKGSKSNFTGTTEKRDKISNADKRKFITHYTKEFSKLRSEINNFIKKNKIRSGEISGNFTFPGSPYPKLNIPTIGTGRANGKSTSTGWVIPNFTEAQKKQLLGTGLERNLTGGSTKTADQKKPNPSSPNNDDVHQNDNDLQGDTPTTLSFNESNFLTPEERRKGIIAHFWDMKDWHLNQISNSGSDIKNLGTNFGKIAESKNGSEEGEPVKGRIVNRKGVGARNKTSFARGDVSTDARARYISALVDAEFYRRRYRARSVPNAGGPFNPYPVPGFPGLIMSPSRPILGMITGVTHTIIPGSATANTSVSMVSPRYWDEGEVWYWVAGREKYDSTQGDVVSPETLLFRNFPQWHNRYCVATNNVQGGKRILSKLDQFYQHHLGTSSIEYLSNHAGLDPSAAQLASFVTQRDVGPFEVNPMTLDFLEKNTMIASVGKDGRFRAGTLANRFYGSVRPSTEPEMTRNQNVNEAISYTERYGVNEVQLLSGFLKNTAHRINKDGRIRLVYAGPTFENPASKAKLVLNPIQLMLLRYMNDLEDREVNK